jgi:hypothetical protein
MTPLGDVHLQSDISGWHARMSLTEETSVPISYVLRGAVTRIDNRERERERPFRLPWQKKAFSSCVKVRCSGHRETMQTAVG